MEVRETRTEDVADVMRVINEGKQYFKGKGIDQWQNGYPNEETILKDIEEGNGLVLIRNNRIIGTCYLRFGVEEDYLKIENGEWLNDDPYGVIHRIAVEMAEKGQGYAAELLKYAEKKAQSLGIRNLRIDTHEKNLSMQRWITKNGFVRCGNVYIGGTAPRIAFQKKL